MIQVRKVRQIRHVEIVHNRGARERLRSGLNEKKSEGVVKETSLLTVSQILGFIIRQSSETSSLNRTRGNCAYKLCASAGRENDYEVGKMKKN